MLRKVLILLLSVLGVTSLIGGVGLVTGTVQPPISMLDGSPFHSYLIPGLALGFLVGIPATIATYRCLKDLPKWEHLSIISACAIIIFELVEVAVIGSPIGPSRVMQLFYIALGLIIMLTTSLQYRTRKHQ